MKTYLKIRERAYRAGIDLKALCQRAGVSRGLLEKWKKKEPETLQKLAALEAVLDNIEKQKDNA
jgi:transcriptional regulator with XRE-family HTH domain